MPYYCLCIYKYHKNKCKKISPWQYWKTLWSRVIPSWIIKHSFFFFSIVAIALVEESAWNLDVQNYVKSRLKRTPLNTKMSFESYLYFGGMAMTKQHYDSKGEINLSQVEHSSSSETTHFFWCCNSRQCKTLGEQY